MEIKIKIEEKFILKKINFSSEFSVGKLKALLSAGWVFTYRFAGEPGK
jgi:hypothetical protein